MKKIDLLHNGANQLKPAFFSLFCLCCINLTAQSQWQHIPGPYGGFVKHLEQDGSTVYALSLSRIFRSDDKGLNWAELPGTQMIGRTIDEFTTENGIFYGLSPAQNKVFRSDDTGKSWKDLFSRTVNDPVSDASENTFSVFAHEQDVLIVTDKNIYRSTDKGETWAASSDDLFGYGLKKIFYANGEYFACGGRYIYRSSDHGATWTRVFASASAFWGVNAVGDKIFALYEGAKRIAQSTDGFRTWQHIHTETMWNSNLNSDETITAQIKGNSDTLVCLYFVSTEVSGMYGAKMSYSIDGGQTWNYWSNNNFQYLPLRYTYDFLIHNSHLLLRSNLGLYRSDITLKSIVASDKGLNATDISQIVVSNNMVMANASGLPFIAEYPDNTWQQLVEFPIKGNTYSRYAYIDGNNRFLYHRLYCCHGMYSTDKGKTWNETVTNSPVFSSNFAWRFYGDSKGLIRLSDDLEEDIYISLPEKFKGKSIKGEIEPYEDKLFFYVLDKVSKERQEIWVTDEEGNIKLEAPISPCPRFAIPDYLAYDGKNLTHYCGSDTYTFNNAQEGWKIIFPIDWMTGIPLYHDPTRRIYVLGGITFITIKGKGIYYSTDNSGRFYPMNPQVPYPYVSSLALKDNKLWAGTDGNGMFVTEFETLENQPQASVSVNLYPNPSGGNMTLTSDVFLTEYTPMTLSDATGKMVAERELPPGRYWEIDFALPRGVYFLRIKTQAGVVGKKWVIR